MFQGFVLNHNMSARIIRSNQSLVLQKVTKLSAGKYVCSAVNTEGETLSTELSFRVQCKYTYYILHHALSYLSLTARTLIFNHCAARFLKCAHTQATSDQYFQLVQSS